MDAAHSISPVHPSPSPQIPAVDHSPSHVTQSHDPLLHSSPPSDQQSSSASDLPAKIRKQVEYYFSDENLPTDKFLLKQLKKDKEGFGTCDRPPTRMFLLVRPIHLWQRRALRVWVRKTKKLTKDSSLIVDALKESSELVVSSDGKKVKRLHPFLLHPPSNEDKKVLHPPSKDPMLCIVVVVNLPEDHSTQNIQKMFGGAGSIKSISIHDQHTAAEDSVIKKAMKLVNGKMFALVEYETVEAAEKAVATLNDETDWRNGLRVQFLQNHKVGRKARRGSDAEKGGHARQPVSGKDDNNNHSNEQNDDVVDDQVKEHSSQEKNGRKGQNRSKGRKYHGNNGMGHGTACIIEPSKPPPGPRMPDGTRGFTMGRGRPPMPNHS